MCLIVCVCVCVCVCVFVLCVYICVCVVCVYICMCVCMCVRAQTRLLRTSEAGIEGSASFVSASKASRTCS